jgi:tetratricopeptide (TPR) repeat protein
MAQDETPHEKLAQLRLQLGPLSKEELRDLCFDLGVKYDDLPGEGAAAKARELVDYLERHCRIPDLEHYLAHPPGVWRCLRRRPAVLYLALGAAILLVLIVSGLFSIGGNWNNVAQLLRGTATPTPTVTPTPLPFRPEGANETLIVIANFYHSTGIQDTEAQNEIKQAIEKAKAELSFASLRVEVEPTHLQADDRAGAEALGKRYNASIVIWGADTGVRVTVNFLHLKQPDFKAAQVKISETERTQLANPSAYARFVTQDLPGQLTFLSLFAAGQSYGNRGAFADSLKAIEKAIASLTAGTTVEGLAEAYFWLGWLYQGPMGNSDKAIADYEQALKLQPDYAKAYYNRGLAYYRKGDYDRAIADFTQALKLQPDYATAYYNRGNAYYSKGDTARAIADFDRALKLKPDYAEAYTNRGVAYCSKGEYDRAIEDLNQALKLKPDYADTYINRGSAFAYKGDTARAIADYDQALKLKPDYAEAYVGRGAAYYNKGEYDRAIEDFNQALKLKPDWAEAYVGRGNVYDDKGDTARAIQDFDQALKLKPDYAEAYYNRGLAYYRKGDYDRAIADFTQALKLKLDYANAYTGRGLAYVGKGDTARAITDYDHALKLKPDDAGAYYNRGTAYAGKGEYDRAIADYGQALKLKPDLASAYKNRGAVYTFKGDYAHAITDLRRYLELRPDAADRKEIEEAIQKLEAQK